MRVIKIGILILFLLLPAITYSQEHKKASIENNLCYITVERKVLSEKERLIFRKIFEKFFYAGPYEVYHSADSASLMVFADEFKARKPYFNTIYLCVSPEKPEETFNRIISRQREYQNWLTKVNNLTSCIYATIDSLKMPVNKVLMRKDMMDIVDSIEKIYSVKIEYAEEQKGGDIDLLIECVSSLLEECPEVTSLAEFLKEIKELKSAKRSTGLSH